jgi:hypothetical protein
MIQERSIRTPRVFEHAAFQDLKERFLPVSLLALDELQAFLLG